MNWKNVNITKRNLYETALILILADLIWISSGFHFLQLIIAFILVLFALLIPKIFYPITWLFLLAGSLLSKFVPLLFLSALFYLLITPVALFRRMLGKDNLKLNDFKKNDDSVFRDRGETYKAKDILHPY